MKFTSKNKCNHIDGRGCSGKCIIADMNGQHKALSNLIDAFAADLKKKAKSKALSGRSGWDDENWDVQHINNAAHYHIEKGDPVDVGLFMAFAWNRLEGE